MTRSQFLARDHTTGCLPTAKVLLSAPPTEVYKEEQEGAEGERETVCLIYYPQIKKNWVRDTEEVHIGHFLSHIVFSKLLTLADLVYVIISSAQVNPVNKEITASCSENIILQIVV